ncbi:MAG TPA: hypothetical protein VNT58_02860 [Gaiellaceae bacterium]|nr:hypothetical protein [Gaiellaceae bacterium]
MNRSLLLVLVAIGLLLLALCAWGVQGARRAVTGSRHRRGRVVAA